MRHGNEGFGRSGVPHPAFLWRRQRYWRERRAKTRNLWRTRDATGSHPIGLKRNHIVVGRRALPHPRGALLATGALPCEATPRDPVNRLELAKELCPPRPSQLPLGRGEPLARQTEVAPDELDQAIHVREVPV